MSVRRDLGFGHALKLLKARSPNQTNFIHARDQILQQMHGRLGLGGNLLQRFATLE